MAIDITDLISEFGANYKAGGQGVKDLRKKIYVTGETDRLFVLQPTTDTVIQGADVEISAVLQAYQDTFTKAGDSVFTPRSIQLYQLKMDWEENPTKLMKTWAGFLTSNSLDRKDYPFIKYIIDQHIMKKAVEDWEVNGIYGGAVTSITPGTVKPISGAIMGIKKIINDAITATDITPIALGTPPTDPEDFVDYVEAFVDGIDEQIVPLLQDIAMSHTFLKRFKKGMRKKYNMSYDQADITTVIDTSLKVSGFRSHAGSNKLWTTIQGNAVIGVKAPENQQVFKVESAKRTVSIFTDFWKGIGFTQPQYVFTNDQDLS